MAQDSNMTPTTAPTTPTRLTPDAAGCWVEGSWGHYAIARMVERAAAHGYVDTASVPPFATNNLVDLADRKMLAQGASNPELSDQEEEDLIQGADDVEQWMNDNLAPEGYAFGWHEGEFFLWSIGDWQDGEDVTYF